MSYENANLRFHSERYDSYGLKAPSVPVSINFVLGYHGSADDFPLTMRPDHENADLVLHEMLAWTPDYETKLNEFAQGNRRVHPNESSLNRRKIELITNTSARQSLWDIPAANVASSKYYKYHALGEFAADKARVNWQPNAAREVMEKYFLMIEGRDKYGVKAITRSIDAYAKGRDDEVNVLVVAGLSHAAMASAYATLENHSESLSVKISSNYEDICIDALSSYIIERHQKGSLSEDTINVLAERFIEEERISTNERSTHHMLARHYGRNI